MVLGIIRLYKVGCALVYLACHSPSWGVWLWPGRMAHAHSHLGDRAGLEEERLLGFPKEFLFHLLRDKDSTYKG